MTEYQEKPEKICNYIQVRTMSNIVASSMVAIDKKTGLAYSLGNVICTSCKKCFLNPRNMRIHFTKKHTKKSNRYRYDAEKNVSIKKNYNRRVLEAMR